MIATSSVTYFLLILWGTWNIFYILQSIECLIISLPCMVSWSSRKKPSALEEKSPIAGQENRQSPTSENLLSYKEIRRSPRFKKIWRKFDRQLSPIADRRQTVSPFQFFPRRQYYLVATINFYSLKLVVIVRPRQTRHFCLISEKLRVQVPKYKL